MKTAVYFIAIVAVAWALPKDLKFKRLYIDPLRIPDNVIPRIVNGEEVAPNSIPYQAFIILSGPSLRWICGGSLISTRFVLTAAHCLIGASSATVYLGAHNVNLDDEDTRIVVSSVNLIPHEDYDGSSISNDIGLIAFSTPIQLTEAINVVSIPQRGGVDDYVGAVGRVSGWGLTDSTSESSPVLLAVNSSIISNRICNTYYGIVQDHQVCISGAQGGGTCNGDSGSPLIVGNEQIGIVSFGAQGCLRGYPSAFTRTDYFLDWLQARTDIKF